MFATKTISPRGDFAQWLGIQGWRITVMMHLKVDATEAIEELLGAFLVSQGIGEQ